ncbi:MAG: phosphate-binding protein, partial [Gammaproteobacteria bacterium]|nr:phosphate-binding protein [Gammaproteobacteria bacterium]
SGNFPLSRFLYIYVNKAPNKPLEPVVAEFMKLIMSKQGQEVVVKDGYVPLPAAVAERTLQELELN